ncbi:unnamed protein product [Rhizoctonia solani]|uniref:Uncharacterized protein n=1 Tax=Rhizoctonia solani TaxID=456999 RepID=A0A8H3A7G4_9AGAM|nr:unnamed protein product [Rhizoctonia solani]
MAMQRESNPRPPLPSVCEAALNEFDAHVNIIVLAGDVLGIQDYFDQIYRTLHRLEIERPPNKPRSRIKSFFTSAAPVEPTILASVQWDSIRKEYCTHLWESRRLATTVAGRAEGGHNEVHFRTRMIPKLKDTNRSLEEKKRALAQYLEDTRETEGSAMTMAKGFMEIQTKIKDFQCFCGNLIEKYKNDVDLRMMRLDTQIQILVSKIEMHTARLADLWKELRVGIPIQTGDAVGDRMLEAIGALLGASGRESLLSKIFRGNNAPPSPSKIYNEVSLAKTELKAKQIELKELEKSATSLQYLVSSQTKVATTRSEDICNRLGAIANIWGVIRTDAQTLHDCIADANRATEEQDFNTLLLRREKLIPLYAKLETVLRKYASAVAVSPGALLY